MFYTTNYFNKFEINERIFKNLKDDLIPIYHRIRDINNQESIVTILYHELLHPWFVVHITCIL